MVPNQARLNAARISGTRFREENLFARALLHFIGGAVCESDHDETRQRAQGIGCLRNLRDAIGDGARFAGTSRGDDGEIAVERLRETIACRLIARFHCQLSSSIARSGWVSSQRSSMISGSIDSVASG